MLLIKMKSGETVMYQETIEVTMLPKLPVALLHVIRYGTREKVLIGVVNLTEVVRIDVDFTPTVYPKEQPTEERNG